MFFGLQIVAVVIALVSFPPAFVVVSFLRYCLPDWRWTGVVMRWWYRGMDREHGAGPWDRWKE